MDGLEIRPSVHVDRSVASAQAWAVLDRSCDELLGKGEDLATALT